MITNISCVLIVSNAEETLAKCLDSLKDFNEVIVYINNTTDKSKEIAQEYANVVIHEGEFTNYGDTRNKAVSFAKNDWIFEIDADEWLDQQLLDSLKILNLENSKVIYEFKLHRYYMGKIMKGGSYRPEWKERLYNRKETQYQGEVHERLRINNLQLIKLKGCFYHTDPFTNVNDKQQYQNDLVNESKRNLKYIAIRLKNSSKKYSKLYLQFVFIFRFINLYIIKLGFLDGWIGVLSNYRICKYKYEGYLVKNQ